MTQEDVLDILAQHGASLELTVIKDDKYLTGYEAWAHQRGRRYYLGVWDAILRETRKQFAASKVLQIIGLSEQQLAARQASELLDFLAKNRTETGEVAPYVKNVVAIQLLGFATQLYGDNRREIK